MRRIETSHGDTSCFRAGCSTCARPYCRCSLMRLSNSQGSPTSRFYFVSNREGVTIERKVCRSSAHLIAFRVISSNSANVQGATSRRCHHRQYLYRHLYRHRLSQYCHPVDRHLPHSPSHSHFHYNRPSRSHFHHSGHSYRHRCPLDLVLLVSAKADGGLHAASVPEQGKVYSISYCSFPWFHTHCCITDLWTCFTLSLVSSVPWTVSIELSMGRAAALPMIRSRQHNSNTANPRRWCMVMACER